MNFDLTKYLWGRVGCRKHWQRFFILPAFVRPGFDKPVEARLEELLIQFFFTGPHGISIVRVLAQKVSMMLKGLDPPLDPAYYGVLPS